MENKQTQPFLYNSGKELLFENPIIIQKQLTQEKIDNIFSKNYIIISDVKIVNDINYYYTIERKQYGYSKIYFKYVLSISKYNDNTDVNKFKIYYDNLKDISDDINNRINEVEQFYETVDKLLK